MDTVRGWKYQCRDGEDVWEGSIGQLEFHEDYTTFTVIGRGSSLKAHIGKYNGVAWICLPDQEKSCTLAHPRDMYWNSEKLGAVLGNHVDGITVARAIEEYSEYLEGYQGHIE